MKVEKVEDVVILPTDFVEVVKTGNTTQIKYLSHRNTSATIKKIDKHRYVELATGEIKEFEHYAKRVDDKKGLLVSFSKARDLINANFFGASNELFITLTYADNVQDTKKIYKDFEAFKKRLKRYLKVDTADFKYLVAVEPQGRGAYHFHLLIKQTNVKNLYIKNEKVADLWGFGFVNVRRLKNNDNVGAYLTAYLTNTLAPDDLPDEAVDFTADKSHRVIKGERLKLYPSGLQIFRHSNNLEEPKKYMTTYKKALESVQGQTKTFEKNSKITPDEDVAPILSHKEFYNKNRKD